MSESPASVLARKETSLRASLRGLGRALVAYSAGVDSTCLLAVAHQELGAMATAVIADSPSLPRSTLAEARAFCRARGIALREIATDELSQPAYVANDGQRCAHCKTALMRGMEALAAIDGGGVAILLGVNTDDLSDWRPGQEAARARGARFPLLDAGLSKDEVRALSRQLGLPTWDRPAEPCLASRVPYGEPVTAEGLAMIERAELALRSAGFRTCRARHHRLGANPDGSPRGWLCRIEVPAEDLPRLVAQRQAVLPAIRALGYASVTLDLGGLVSGGYNALLGGVAAEVGSGRRAEVGSG